MQALVNGIVAMFAGDTGSGGLQPTFPGYANQSGPVATTVNLWQDIAPENAPYTGTYNARCVFVIDSSVTTPLYGDTTYYGPTPCTIRYTAYCIGQNNATTVGDILVGRLDALKPSLATGSLINQVRRGDAVPQWEGKDAQGKDIFRVDLVYEYTTSVP